MPRSRSVASAYEPLGKILWPSYREFMPRIKGTMHTIALLGSLLLVMLAPASVLGQDRTCEWQWGMHPVMFMWGAGGLVMMLMMLVF
jgi:hypothetical protein